MKQKIPWRQNIYEAKRYIAQQLIFAILKVFGVAIVANYVKEINMVQLEIIPSYLLKNREREMEIYKGILEGEGDKITTKEEEHINEIVKNKAFIDR